MDARGVKNPGQSGATSPVMPMTDGSGFLSGFRFEPAASPSPMTLDEIGALLGRIEAGKKRIACATDVFEQIRDTVYGRGYGIYFKVLECSWLEGGQVVLMLSEAEEQAGLERVGRQTLDKLLERWAREQRMVDEFRRWYCATVHQPKPFPPIIPIIAGV